MISSVAYLRACSLLACPDVPVGCSQNNAMLAVAPAASVAQAREPPKPPVKRACSLLACPDVPVWCSQNNAMLAVAPAASVAQAREPPKRPVKRA